ncbi:MAG: tetratricopeptide repeat protein, partial [Akkermansiaceae bacterium]
MLKAITIITIAAVALIQLTVSSHAAPNQSRAMRELSKLPAFVEGAKAMTDQLPDVAVGNFRSVLANKKLSDDARAYATLSLIEALVSASLTANADPNLSAEALELLSNKQVAALPSAPIWRAEALASQGRYQDAAKALADLKSSHPNYTAILMARSRIHLALRQTDTAIDILSQITKTKGDTTAKLRDEANLLIAETHIDTGHNQQALQALEKIDEQNLRAAKLKEYLQARLVLSEGNSAEAIDRFQSIISD